MLAFTIAITVFLLSLYTCNPYCDLSMYFLPLCHGEPMSASLNYKLHEKIHSLCSFEFAISLCH